MSIESLKEIEMSAPSHSRPHSASCQSGVSSIRGSMMKSIGVSRELKITAPVNSRETCLLRKRRVEENSDEDFG